MHVYSFGAPERVYSDLGTNLVAGANVISDFIKDVHTQVFFRENHVKPIVFNHYYKGCSKLGSLVESCVKIVKKLIYGSIRNLILNLRDLQFLIAQVVHLANRRPVAFKEALRDCSTTSNIPSPITPEMLMRGYELVSLNLVPALQEDHSADPDWKKISGDISGNIKNSFSKLNKVRAYLNKEYHEQFIPNLINQAVNIKDRYKPVLHKNVSVGDIVLLKEPMLKPSNYPLGIVTKAILNDLQEVTSVDVRKGCNREIVKRHIETIIPLLTSVQESTGVCREPVNDSIYILKK